jgi:hypothetical protein
VRAFRLTPRLRQVLGADPEISRVSVTVLADFTVLVEAPSYPDRELHELAPFCRAVKEDGPTHELRLDRKAVVALAAGRHRPDPPTRQVLERLSRHPLPPNVATEIEAWCGHAEKLTVYEHVALVELRGPDALRAQVKGELGGLVLDDRAPGMLVTGDPERTLSVLEQRERVPLLVAHRSNGFAACDGPLGKSSAELQGEAVPVPAAPRRRVRVETRDLVGYQTEDAGFLDALQAALERVGVSCQRAAENHLLLVPAPDLARARAALRRLEERFDVQLER